MSNIPSLAEIAALEVAAGFTPREVIPAGKYDAIVTAAEFGYSKSSGLPTFTVTYSVQHDGKEHEIRGWASLMRKPKNGGAPFIPATTVDLIKAADPKKWDEDPAKRAALMQATGWAESVAKAMIGLKAKVSVVISKGRTEEYIEESTGEVQTRQYADSNNAWLESVEPRKGGTSRKRVLA